MFTKNENTGELIVVYCHHFDPSTGLYAASAIAGVCREAELVTALNQTLQDWDTHAAFSFRVVAALATA